jgi:hypothetical protein
MVFTKVAMTPVTMSIQAYILGPGPEHNGKKASHSAQEKAAQDIN